MERKEHIEQMKLLGRMLGAPANGIRATAVNAGLEYAQRLTTDTTLRAEVNKTFNPSLAARDFKRAAEVLEKYRKTPEPVKVATPTLTLEYKAELEALDILGQNTDGSY